MHPNSSKRFDGQHPNELQNHSTAEICENLISQAQEVLLDIGFRNLKNFARNVTNQQQKETSQMTAQHYKMLFQQNNFPLNLRSLTVAHFMTLSLEAHQSNMSSKLGNFSVFKVLTQQSDELISEISKHNVSEVFTLRDMQQRSLTLFMETSSKFLYQFECFTQLDKLFVGFNHLKKGVFYSRLISLSHQKTLNCMSCV